MTGIEEAVRKVGSQTILATQLKSRFPQKKHPSQQAISNWVRVGYVPLARAAEVSAISGVPVERLVSPAVRELLAKK